MAVNETRSMNADLREGLTDGSVKKDAPDRGGVTEPDAHQRHLLQQQYGTSVGYADEAARRLTQL